MPRLWCRAKTRCIFLLALLTAAMGVCKNSPARSLIRRLRRRLHRQLVCRQVQHRLFSRVTPQGIIQSTQIHSSKAPSMAPTLPESRVLGPSGNTVWQYNDATAIADGVSIDANNVWGAWTLSGARLTIHAITGNG